MRPTFRPAPFLVVASALAAVSCGPSQAELDLAAARAAHEEETRKSAALAAAVEAERAAVATARAELNSLRAVADEAKATLEQARREAAEAVAKAAASDDRIQHAEKDLKEVRGHRDELVEWIEQDLLPVAEKHVPELANLRDATEEMQKEVARIRGLEWKTPVMRRRIRRAQMGEWMQRDLRKELPEEKAREIVLVGAEMGLVPEKTDLYAMFSEFMEAGVAAFYRPDTRTFYHIEGNDGRGAYPIVFHELVHAVEDQHFDLFALQKAVDGNSDAGLARKGLTEGTASLFQDLYQKEHPQDVVEMVKSQATPEMQQRQAKMMQRVPTFLVATMALYPYNNGKAWVRRMTGGDPAKAAALFADPPASTEQVLHPEKYADPANRDYPHQVAAPDIAPVLPGWKVLEPDDMGELVMGCLLAQLRFNGMGALMHVLDMGTQGFGLKEPTRTAVAGWDGDRVASAIDPATGRATICWVTVWDTPKDAEEFVDAYAPLLAKKVTRQAAPKELPEPIRFEEPGTGRVTRIVREGTRVVAVIGAPADKADGLLRAGLDAKVTADARDRNDVAK